MTKEDKELMLIFGSPERRQFLCDNVFPELVEILPRNRVLNTTFAREQVRKRAKLYALTSIVSLLEQVKPIYEELTKLYVHKPISEIANDILIAYTYYLSKVKPISKTINIFTSKASVVYIGVDLFGIV